MWYYSVYHVKFLDHWGVFGVQVSKMPSGENQPVVQIGFACRENYLPAGQCGLFWYAVLFFGGKCGLFSYAVLFFGGKCGIFSYAVLFFGGKCELFLYALFLGG